jgi:hypothetical protein
LNSIAAGPYRTTYTGRGEPASDLPLLRGWLILEPRRHVEHLAELTEPEAAALEAR